MMVTSITSAQIEMLPYQRGGEIDYASLGFDPFDSPEKPDGMRQRPSMYRAFYILRSRFSRYDRSPHVFADFDTDICYNPQDLSEHISPDVCLAFGVDAKAIRERALYLPWEVGKPPDWVLEVGSKSTGKIDVEDKVARYEQIGVREYWRFDPSGGQYHGDALNGDILVDGKYQPVELTRNPDGVLKAYSPVLELWLNWIEQPDGLGLPVFYEPVMRTYLESDEEVAADRDRERQLRLSERQQLMNERQQRHAAEAEVRRLRAELRRRTSE